MMARPWSLPGHSFSAAWEHSAQGVLPGYIYVDQSTYEEHRGPGAYDIQKDRLGKLDAHYIPCTPDCTLIETLIETRYELDPRSIP
jgi:hypothetical protein